MQMLNLIRENYKKKIYYWRRIINKILFMDKILSNEFILLLIIDKFNLLLIINKFINRVNFSLIIDEFIDKKIY